MFRNICEYVNSQTGSKKNADGVTWDKFENEVTFPAKFFFKDSREISKGFSTLPPTFNR